MQGNMDIWIQPEANPKDQKTDPKAATRQTEQHVGSVSVLTKPHQYISISVLKHLNKISNEQEI